MNVQLTQEEIEMIVDQWFRKQEEKIDTMTNKIATEAQSFELQSSYDKTEGFVITFVGVPNKPDLI